jgi:N6-adenosine-specific RNA methylase IME4
MTDGPERRAPAGDLIDAIREAILADEARPRHATEAHAPAATGAATRRSRTDPSADFAAALGGRRFGCILADPPWQFVNRTGKMAPEHKRLSRYGTMDLAAISRLPVADVSAATSHLYLWVPNALLPEGLQVMKAWGFSYKSNIVWHKLRKDGGSDGRGVGFYFRNVTEILLFGVRGKNARTLQAGRTQVNYVGTRKREHSRKPDEAYPIIESCSPGPRLELFARGTRPGWTAWGNQAAEDYEPDWDTYAHNSASERRAIGPAAA